MQPFLRIYTPIMQGLARVAIVFCGTCLAALIVVTGWMVYGRYVLNDPPTWAESTSLILVLFVSACGAAVGIRERLHLRIVLFLELVSPRTRLVLEIFVNALLLFFGLLMVHGGYGAAAQVWAFPDAMLPVPRGIYYVPMIITGGLISLFEVEILAELLSGWNTVERRGNA
mgnify:FL=1